MFWNKNKNINETKEIKKEVIKNTSDLKDEKKEDNTKLTPHNLIVGTYKYFLKISNTDKTISGFIEASDSLEAENKLKAKYSFEESSLKLKKEKEFSLNDVFLENNFFNNIPNWDIVEKETKKEEQEKNSEKLKNAINNEADNKKTDTTNKENFFKKIVDLFHKLEKKYKDENSDLSKKLIQIDYRKIIEYEERLKKLEEESKDNRLKKLSGVIEKKFDQLQEKLMKLQVKIEDDDFKREDNIDINKLRIIIDEFETRVHTVIEKIKEEGKSIPTRIRRVGRRALNLIDELDDAKKGNVPPHVKQKVVELRLAKEKEYADKIADQTTRIREKIQYLHQVLPDLDSEKEIKDIEKKIKVLEKKYYENRRNPILVKYHPHLADQEVVKQFEGMEHTISLDSINYVDELEKHNQKNNKNKKTLKNKKIENKALKGNKNLSLIQRVQKFGVTGTLEQMKLNFKRKGGMKGLFERTRDSILGREKIDILGGNEGKQNVIDDINFSDKEHKMKKQFNFHITDKEKKKKEDADKKIINGTKQTGNIMIDFLNLLNDFLIDMGKVKTKEKAVFYRLLAVMVSAGIPLIKSLHELVNQQENPKFKKALHKLTLAIEAGSSLSRAMMQFPDIFDESIIGMIKSGEVSGTLPQILARIAENIEKSAALAGKVKGAMMYPIVLVFVLVGAVTAILVLVLPKLMPMFEGSGQELPMSTRSLIFASELLQHQGHFILMGIFLFVTIMKKLLKTYEGKFYKDLIVIKVPIFGKLLTNMLLAKFSRTLSSLTSSGLSIIKALKINADSIGNEVYKLEILEIANKVKLGHTIGETLEGNRLFPTMLVNMIKVGEESAALGDVSARLAKFYEEETNDMVKNLTTLMEPIIITSLAAVVGFIMMAIMQPILALTENIG